MGDVVRILADCLAFCGGRGPRECRSSSREFESKAMRMPQSLGGDSFESRWMSAGTREQKL